MNKFFFFFILALFFIIPSVNAAAYKGQRIFVKKCVSCHTSKQSFIKTKTVSQWEDLMENRGKPLADLHLKDKKAKDSWEYFKSKKYNKKSKHLKDFLMEYAKDSGNVPACN
ncbi:MAG: cytochrome C [Campylobacterota bacterium]|nr:cytochrome C [Campylobacterota bacterium]